MYALSDFQDTTNQIIVQVSATSTKQKIESALSKGNHSQYKGYGFKFISISKDASQLKKRSYLNPHNLNFVPSEDILDINSILRCILDMQTDQQKKVHKFLEDELKLEPAPDKIESNLTTIINILSKVNWNNGTMGLETVPYDLENKISYNKLDTARILIDDFKIHYHRIDCIYSNYDEQGVNKSLSILNGIRNLYFVNKGTSSPDKCFFSIIDNVIQKIRDSSNYSPIPEEELVLCVQILVVDAFIRCKIFKNPSKEH